MGCRLTAVAVDGSETRHPRRLAPSPCSYAPQSRTSHPHEASTLYGDLPFSGGFPWRLRVGRR